MYSITLDNKQYAAGLWWQIRDGGAAGKKDMLALARETAEAFEESGYTCVALRSHQYGLGTCLANVPVLPSLAAAVRSPATLMGLFALEKTPDPLDVGHPVVWWVAGINAGDKDNEGMIAADGDAVFETEQEARHHLEARLRNLFEANQKLVFCPTPEESLAFLRPLLSPDARLESLYVDLRKRRKTIRILVGAGLFAGALLGGINFYQAWQEQTVQELAVRTFQSKEAHHRRIRSHPERHFTKTWLDAPSPERMAGVCLKVLLDAPLAANGWFAEVLTCQGKSLNVQWGHRPGADYLHPPHPDATFGKTPRTMTSRSALSIPTRKREDVPLLPRMEIERRLYQLTQMVSAKITPRWQPPETKIVEEVEVTAPWRRGTWELKDIPAIAILDAVLFNELGKLPGLTIERISRDKSKWTITGDIYAK